MTDIFPLAPDGIFRTVQGEGALIGELMVFVRLAGCSIGCDKCDTNYSVATKATAKEIAWKVAELATCTNWVWITGGEPTDHDLTTLIHELRRGKFRIALATAGHKKIPERWNQEGGVDWLSVSPHSPVKWKQMAGQELKLIPGLNGFFLRDFEHKIAGTSFGHNFVSPCEGLPETIQECLGWIESHQNWRMTGQLHKQWGML